MWVGDIESIFFPTAMASVSLFAYDTKTKQVAEALHSDGLDFKDRLGRSPTPLSLSSSGRSNSMHLNTHQGEECRNPR